MTGRTAFYRRVDKRVVEIDILDELLDAILKDEPVESLENSVNAALRVLLLNPTLIQRVAGRGSCRLRVVGFKIIFVIHMAPTQCPNCNNIGRFLVHIMMYLQIFFLDIF